MSIKSFSINTVGSDYVVGDIHGCFTELEKVLKRKNFNPEIDRLFSVGDLVDRGEESERSLEFIRHSWFHTVMGNHEQMAILYYTGSVGKDWYIRNGGEWFTELSRSQQSEYVKVFSKLPILIEVETSTGLVGIVHAECPTDDWNFLKKYIDNEMLNKRCLWSRDRITDRDDERVENCDRIYCGHTPINQPVKLGNHIFIDTGVVFGRYLTLIKL